MTPRYPGFEWKPAGTFQGSMNGLRGLGLHEAVTTAYDVWDWVNQENSCHLFDGPTGKGFQYKEFDELAWGMFEGNHNMITYESWDGLRITPDNPATDELNAAGQGSNQTVWTEQQLERKADVFAWFCVVLGLPCQMMASSDPAQSGLAPHRWGIAPWRDQLGGGETWTRHEGKPCPGDLRVESMPGIVARARQIIEAVNAGRCTWLPDGDVDLPSALARTKTQTTQTTAEGDLNSMADITPAQMDQIAAKVWGFILSNKASAADNVAASNTRIMRIIQSIEGRTVGGGLGVLGRVAAVAAKLGVK